MRDALTRAMTYTALDDARRRIRDRQTAGDLDAPTAAKAIDQLDALERAERSAAGSNTPQLAASSTVTH